MGWLYHLNYFGPDRRSKGFQVRFIERRREDSVGTRASLRESLAQLWARGLSWVDHFNYFGPDRRAEVFSFFFLERRREQSAGPPPALHAALRQLRVRVMDAHDAAGRAALCERFTATAVLADAQGRGQIGDLLMKLVSALDAADEGADLRPMLHAELIRAEAMQS